MLKAAAQEGMTGGRIYDAHIAHVARAAGATVDRDRQSAPFPRVASLRHQGGDAAGISQHAENRLAKPPPKSTS